MGTSVFPFTKRGRNLEERFLHVESATPPDGGKLYRRLRGKHFVVRNLELLFPDTPVSQDFDDFDTFWETTLGGGVETFLYAAANPHYRIIEGESGGTSSGGAGEEFTLDRKFVHHTDFGEASSTLVVKVDEVVQALTTDYTFSGNGTAPKITTTASFDAGAVTFDYEFYFQVYGFLRRVADLVQGPSLTSYGTKRVFLELLEQASGGSLA